LISLLPDEQPLADLRRGRLQTVSEEIVGRRTMVLTDKRLWLIHKRMLSFSTTVVFLKDITAIEAKRTIRGTYIAVAILYGFVGLILTAVAASGSIKKTEEAGLAGVGGIVCLAIGVSCALGAVSNAVCIYTTMKPIEFRLTLRFPIRRIQSFVNEVQTAMSQFKSN
jgi:hypothetical protein